MKETTLRGELWEVERPDNSKLYDRDNQSKMLLNAYERCCRHLSGAQREMVVITGPSGGKRHALTRGQSIMSTNILDVESYLSRSSVLYCVNMVILLY